MDIFEKKSKELSKVIIKITVMQLLLLIITCCLGMYMTSKELYNEQIFLVPFHAILLLGIIRLNNRWYDRIDAM